jgi:hypothetical protein
MTKRESPLKSLSISLFDSTDLRSVTEQPSLLSVIKQACKDKNFACLKYILQAANFVPEEPVDDFGNTILHYAIINFHDLGELPFIQQLLSMKGIENILNAHSTKDGLTPAILACSLKLHPVIDLLVARGADIKQESRNGAMLVTATETEAAPVKQESPKNESSGVAQYLTSFLRGLTSRERDLPETSAIRTLQLTQQPEQPEQKTSPSKPSEEKPQSDLRTTEFFRDIIEKQLPIQQEVQQQPVVGGSTNAIVGQRLIHRMSEVSSISYGGAKKKSSKKSKRMSVISRSHDELGRITDDIHTRTIETIKNLLEVSEEDAKLYKSVLYYKVKEDHPDLSGYQRAVEMEKLATKKELEKIDLESAKKKRDEIKSDHEKEKLATSSESESPKKQRKSKKSKVSDEGTSSESESEENPKKKSSKKKSKKDSESVSASSSDTTSSPRLDTTLTL